MPRSSFFHLHFPDLFVPADSSREVTEKLPTETSKVGVIEKITSDDPELEKVTSPIGAFPFFHPTHAHLHVHSQKLDWYSRDHRKGRHPVEHNKRRNINTFLRIEYWNISWWVAFVYFPYISFPLIKLFTLGSAVWVLNGFFSFLPSLNVTSQNNVVLGWTAFAGGTIFEIGSYLMVLEALNRKQVVRSSNFCN